MHSRPTSTARPARARSTRCRLLRRSSVSRIVSSGSQPAAAGRPKGSRSRWRRANSGACPRLDCRGVETPKAIDAMAYPGKRTCSLLQMASPATFRAYAPRKLMMKCPRCQHENQTAANFCEECAVPLARTCPSCGSRAAATAKFCPECGRSLIPRAGDPRFASPQSYTPHHLAQKIYLKGGARRRAEAHHSPFCGRERVDGTAGGTQPGRPGGGSEAPRSGHRTHDRGGSSL